MFAGSSVALVTPMHVDGSIDFSAWDRLLDVQANSGTAAVFVGGTTGESATLTQDELFELVRRARDRLRGRIEVWAGAGQSGTAATINLAREIAKLDIDGLLIATPAYVKPTQEGLYQHYRAIAQAVDAPIMLYNVPGRTAVDMLPDTVARLAALPGIVAIKEATPDPARCAAIFERRPGFAVFSGDDATACESLFKGACGVVSVTGNVAPRAMADLVAAALRGDRAAASALDESLRGLHTDLFLETNPIPVKWALARMGLIESGIRLPLTPMTASLAPQIEAALARARLL